MSVTYHIKCRDCNKSLWVGQSLRLYQGVDAVSGRDHIEMLEEFLAEHRRHSLVYISEHELYGSEAE